METTKSGLPIVNQEQLQNLLNKSDKGILVLGKPGVGKTHIYSNHFNRSLSSHTLMTAYCENGMEAMKARAQQHVIQKGSTQILYIDDIGTEQNAIHYGQQIDVIQWLIYRAYELDIKLYLTTNLNMEELQTRYGLRAVDRLKQMCYVVVLEGKNFRAAEYNKNIQNLIDAKQEA